LNPTRAPRIKSFLVLFFKKELLAFTLRGRRLAPPRIFPYDRRMRHLFMAGVMHGGGMHGGMAGFMLFGMLRRLIMKLVIMVLVIAVVVLFIKWQQERARNRIFWD